MLSYSNSDSARRIRGEANWHIEQNSEPRNRTTNMLLWFRAGVAEWAAKICYPYGKKSEIEFLHHNISVIQTQLA